MSELKEQTISGVKWNAIGRFAAQGISFVIGIFLARILTPSDFGVVGMIAIFMAISQTFIDSGFGSALIRKNDCTEDDYSTAFYFNILVGILCYIVLFFSSPFIADFFQTPILKDVVRVFAINLFLNSLTIVQVAKLTKIVDFKSQAIVNLIATVISGCLGLFLAYNGYGVWSLVYQTVALSTVRAILLWMVTKWRPLLIFSKPSFRYLFGFGSKILSASLLHTIYSNLTTILIGRYYTSKDLGYYSRGESLAALPSTNLIGILQSVTYPILSKIQDDDVRLINVYRKYIRMTSIIIFFGMFLLAALARPLIISLLTERWTDSIIYLQVFCFAYMFDHICQLNLNILYVKGRSDLVLRLEVIKKTISISMIVAAIPFGVLAICIARALYTQVAVIINTYYTGKLFNLGYLAQVKDFSKYLIVSLIAVLPAFLLTFTPINSILTLLLGTIIAIVIYWLLLRRDIYFIELISTIRKKSH